MKSKVSLFLCLLLFSAIVVSWAVQIQTSQDDKQAKNMGRGSGDDDGGGYGGGKYATGPGSGWAGGGFGGGGGGVWKGRGGRKGGGRN